jgi:hypothetical protein
MKTKHLISLWAAYARKALVASNGNLPATVRMMNMNCKYRNLFSLDGNRIMFRDQLVLDVPQIHTETVDGDEVYIIRDAAGNPLEFDNGGDPFYYSVPEHAVAARLQLIQGA